MITIPYTIKIQHELLVGSGAAVPGLADAITQTDVNGYPRIPRETIKGLIRDRFQDIFPHEMGTLNKLFGVEGKERGMIRFSDARIDPEFVKQANELNLASDFFPGRTHVTISRKDRRAEDDKLFYFLYADMQGVPFKGRIYVEREHERLDMNERQRSIAAIIIALVGILEIGGKRRRGPGAARFIPHRDKELLALVTGKDVNVPQNPEEEAEPLTDDEWEAVINAAFGEEEEIDARTGTNP